MAMASQVGDRYMAITITDTTKNPSFVPSAQVIAPYKTVTVTDTAPLSATETVTITLAQSETNNPGNNFSYYPMATDFGTISDPNGGGTFNPSTETFTESGVVGGDPNFATSLLRRLQYNAPKLPNGQGFATQAQITVTDGGVTTSDSTPVIVGVLSPPSITGTVANEPIASGNKIPPFATLIIVRHDGAKRRL